MATKMVEADRPVPGEPAPVLKVLVSDTPMARLIREQLAERSATPDPGERGSETAATH